MVGWGAGHTVCLKPCQELRLIHSLMLWYKLCISLSGKLLLLCQGLLGIFLYVWYIPLHSYPQCPILNFLDMESYGCLNAGRGHTPLTQHRRGRVSL